MIKVTKESLVEKIKRLESRGNAEYALGLTLNEEYQLEAYKMLLARLGDDVVTVPVEPTRAMRLQIHPITEATCLECGCRVTADCEDNVLMSWEDVIKAAPEIS